MSGHCLEVIFAKRRGDQTVFVCSVTPEGQRFTLPQAWTDRGAAAVADDTAVEGRVSAETLSALRGLTRQIDLG